MFLGIFDTFQIQEYHGYITDWWAIIATILGTGIISGFVAFFAAKWQINNQKRHREEIKNQKDKFDRQYLKYLIDNFIEEIRQTKSKIKEDIVSEEIDKDEVYTSYNWYFFTISQKLSQFGANRIFELLFSNQTSTENIQKFTTFINSIDKYTEIIKLLNADLEFFLEQHKVYTNKINELYQDLIKQFDYDNVHENPLSIFGKGSDIDKKIKEILEMRKNDEIKNPLYSTYIASDYMYNYTINKPLDRSNLKLIHEYVIPLYNEFNRMKFNFTNINKKLNLRNKDLESISKNVETFHRIIK